MLDSFVNKLTAHICSDDSIKVIAFGENHYEPNPFRSLFRMCLEPLAHLGFLTVALEIHCHRQEFIDQEFKDASSLESLRNLLGSRSPTSNESVPVLDDHVAMFDKMRQLGQQLMAVDTKNRNGTIRNRHAAALIQSAISEGLKIIVNFGSIHLARTKESDSRRLVASPYMTITDLIESRGTRVFTIAQVGN
ncbi:MAG: hypothetical protein ACRD3W_11315 [Terriglobales bacterium]